LAAAVFERIYDARQHRLAKNGADIVNRHPVQTYRAASNRSPCPKPERFLAFADRFVKSGGFATKIRPRKISARSRG